MKLRLLAILGILGLILVGCPADDDDVAVDDPDDAEDVEEPAEVTTYNFAFLSDFSGPYADIFDDWQGGRDAAVEWWNDNPGSEIGVRIEGRAYDHRYDAGQIASMWPGIVSELDPIAAFGVGGVDVAALSERLPSDGIGLYMSTAGYGYGWVPDPWTFNPRPSYAHEFAAFLQWYRDEGFVDEVRVGSISSEDAAPYVDIVEGTRQWVEQTDGIEWVGTEWGEIIPTDLSTEVRGLLAEGANVFDARTNTAAAAAIARALREQGADDAVLMVSSHNSLTASGEAIGDLCQFEGYYEAYSMVIPAEESGPAFEFFETLRDDYGLEADWTVPTAQGIQQALYALRIVEQAAAEHGAENLTGELVRETALTAEVSTEDTFGFTADLRWTGEAPFPIEGTTVNIGGIEDCEYVVVANDVPVPQDLEPW